MGTNSIRSNISKEDIVSDIKLTLNADVKKEEVLLIVEGSDDIKFLRKFIRNNVELIESFSGKEGIKEIIEKYFNNEIRVIGIRDRDYATEKIHDRILFYDNTCLEMMIISYKQVFEMLYYEYYESGKLNFNELLECLLNNIRHISIMRKYNEIHSLGINFKGISISNIIENGKLSINKLIEELKNRNPKNNKCNFDNIKKMLEIELNKNLRFDELINITQGHDFISIFQLHCKRDNGREPSKDSIAASLRCIFNKKYFENTKLHRNLIEYEKKSNIRVLK